MTTSPRIRSPRPSACPANTTRRRWRCSRATTPGATWSSPMQGSAWRACRVGATHIDNPVSIAPGFRIGNVHVMAGVPGDFPGHARQRRADAEDRREAFVRHHSLPAWRGRHRRAARRNPEGASRHDHRLLSEISRRLVLDRTRRARPLPRSVDAARQAVEEMVARLPKRARMRCLQGNALGATWNAARLADDGNSSIGCDPTPTAKTRDSRSLGTAPRPNQS